MLSRRQRAYLSRGVPLAQSFHGDQEEELVAPIHQLGKVERTVDLEAERVVAELPRRHRGVGVRGQQRAHRLVARPAVGDEILVLQVFVDRAVNGVAAALGAEHADAAAGAGVLSVVHIGLHRDFGQRVESGNEVHAAARARVGHAVDHRLVFAGPPAADGNPAHLPIGVQLRRSPIARLLDARQRMRQQERVAPVVRRPLDDRALHRRDAHRALRLQFGDASTDGDAFRQRPDLQRNVERGAVREQQPHAVAHKFLEARVFRGDRIIARLEEIQHVAPGFVTRCFVGQIRGLVAGDDLDVRHRGGARIPNLTGNRSAKFLRPRGRNERKRKQTKQCETFHVPPSPPGFSWHPPGWRNCNKQALPPHPPASQNLAGIRSTKKPRPYGQSIRPISGRMHFGLHRKARSARMFSNSR